MEHDKRPWGEYFVLDNSKTHKVKRIVVKPEQRLSYQFHYFRSEVWVVASGEALITIEGVEKVYQVGDVAQIPKEAKHRVENKGINDLIFIEVQWGTYFGEDDIVRIEDDYQRE
jgi:mannose-6-phosphate isomerase